MYVRQAAEYLEANLARRVRLAQLVSLTGVSGRSIQLGFQRHRGCSPLAFLRARRLEQARTMLLLGIPSTVTDVALACGFEHLSRFAALYRSRFGELPVETRERVLRERVGSTG
jgi:transcriptional regulator GlxA family with amidase domain